jgi:hypothetical protein
MAIQPADSEKKYLCVAAVRFNEFITSLVDVPLDPARSNKDIDPGQQEVRTAQQDHLGRHALGIEHGFAVVMRLLAFAPPAYVEHCWRQGETPNTASLRDILNRQQSYQNTVLKLAMMSGIPNSKWEVAAHIRADLPASPYERQKLHSLAIVPGSDGPVLDFSADTHSRVPDEFRDDSLPPTPQETTCPAQPYLPKIWRQLASDCFSTGVFTDDIASLTGTPHASTYPQGLR